jgi:hypothetical protein
MKVGIGSAAVGLALMASVLPLAAHHTIAAVYDVTKLVTLKGVVAQVDWQFPHIIFHLDARNDDGTVARWDVETENPQGLRRRGLTQDFVKAGDAVTMDVFVAKDGTQHAAAETITSSTGTTNVSMVPNQPRR